MDEFVDPAPELEFGVDLGIQRDRQG